MIRLRELGTIPSAALTRGAKDGDCRMITEASPEKLVRDVRVLLNDAEELIKATMGDIGERTREGRAKLAGALAVTRETCNQLDRRLAQRVRAANAIVQKRPFEMIGVAFGMGMVLGILLDRFWADAIGPMTDIKFGTDGWRAVIAEDFTFANVERVAQATADYWSGNPVPGTENKVIIGYDRRFLSDQFAFRTC